MKRVAAILCFSVAAVYVCIAEDVTKEEIPVPVLGPPKVMKLDWSSHSPYALDIDGDGRTDLAVLNNDHVRIDLLYQRTPAELKKEAKVKYDRTEWRPILENAPFLKDSVVTGERMYGLAAADVDKDGRTDLIYTSLRQQLTVLFQDKDELWEQSWNYDQVKPQTLPGTLAVGDVNEDGNIDIVALMKDEIVIFMGNGSRIMPTPLRFRTGPDDAQALKLVDLNEDGRTDLVYLSKRSKQSIFVRIQLSNGEFGPELPIKQKIGRTSWAYLGGDRLAVIRKNLSEILVGGLKQEPTQLKTSDSLQPRIFNVTLSGQEPAAYALGDFDGDGLRDIAAADTGGASVTIFRQIESGDFQRSDPFPSLSRINTLAAWRENGSGTDSLVVSSEEDGIVGISRYVNERLSFPKPLPLEGKPLIAATANVDGKGSCEIAVATRDGRRFNVEVLYKENGGWTNSVVDLGAIEREPHGFITGDINDDKLEDALILIPREPARVLIADGHGAWVEHEDESSVFKGQLNDLRPEKVTIGDWDGNGTLEVMVADKGYIRSFSLKKDEKLEIFDQANSRQANDDLFCPISCDLDDDGKQDMLVYEAESGVLQWLRQDEKGVYSRRQAFGIGNLKLQKAALEPLPEKSGHRVILFGRDRFWSVGLPGLGLGCKAEDIFRTNLDKVGFTLVGTGDFNNDGAPDIFGVDGKANVLEMLVKRGADWESVMHFQVFEKNPFYRGKTGIVTEPRDYCVGDFTNDGKTDLVLFCHDRMLLYPQE